MKSVQPEFLEREPERRRRTNTILANIMILDRSRRAAFYDFNTDFVREAAGWLPVPDSVAPC
jgi:hypothetical protein